MQNLKPLSLFVCFFALACKKIFIKTHSIDNRCHRIRKNTVCRCVRASFSPNILQAGAVKGLTKHDPPPKKRVTNCCMSLIALLLPMGPRLLLGFGSPLTLSSLFRIWHYFPLFLCSYIHNSPFIPGFS